MNVKSSIMVDFFYSKSKSDSSEVCGRKDWRRILSAFWPSEIVVDGKKFASIELAFHYEKFKRTDKPILGNMYMVGGPFDSEPGKGKLYSGKSSMKKLGCTLDVNKWSRESEVVMAKLVQQRYEKDTIFRHVLREAPRPLLHFERGTMRKVPKYGCFKSKKTGEIIGENFYGKLLMSI